MSSQQYGIAAVRPNAAAHYLGFATARATGEALLEIWNGSSVASLEWEVQPGGRTMSGDGLVGTPGISFINDPDSGLYRIGANNVGLAVAGAKVLDIATTGLAVTGTLSTTGQLSPASLAVTGNTTVGGTLGVTGATTLAGLSASTGAFSSTLDVTGAATFGSTINGQTISSAASLTGTLAVAGATTLAGLSATTGSFSSTLAVTGATTLSSNLSQLASQTYDTVLSLTHEFGASNTDGVDAGEPYRYRWGFAGTAIADGGSALVLTQMLSDATTREALRITQAGALNATHTGNGAGLTALNATQLTSGTVPSGRLSGSYTGITEVGALTAVSLNLGGATLADVLSATALWDPAAMAAEDVASTTVTVTGAAAGDYVDVTNPYLLDSQFLDIDAYVSAVDTVTVVLRNHGAAAVDPASRTIRVVVLKF